MPGIKALVKRYNSLRDQLAAELRAARRNRPLPAYLDEATLFNQENNGELWEDVVNINVDNDDAQAPPRWMVDEDTRQAITATLALDRATEELGRLDGEDEALALWLIANLESLKHLLCYGEGRLLQAKFLLSNNETELLHR